MEKEARDRINIYLLFSLRTKTGSDNPLYHCLFCSKNSYLGNSYWEFDILDESIFREKCKIDLPFLLPEEIEKLVKVSLCG